MSKKYFSVIIVLLIIICSCSKQPIERPEKWAKKIPTENLQNLFMVTDSVYRSEQPDEKSFKDLFKLGISSILNLRTTDTDVEVVKDKKFNLYLVEMRAEYIEEDKVIQALKIIKTAPKPILIHCKHGSDRTGLIMAMYRIVFQGWDKQSAIEEMKDGEFGFHFIYFNITNFINNADITKIKKALG